MTVDLFRMLQTFGILDFPFWGEFFLGDFPFSGDSCSGSVYRIVNNFRTYHWLESSNKTFRQWNWTIPEFENNRHANNDIGDISCDNCYDDDDYDDDHHDDDDDDDDDQIGLKGCCWWLKKTDTVSVPYMIIMLDATHVIVDLSALSKLCLQNRRVKTQFTHKKHWFVLLGTGFPWACPTCSASRCSGVLKPVGANQGMLPSMSAPFDLFAWCLVRNERIYANHDIKII